MKTLAGVAGLIQGVTPATLAGVLSRAATFEVEACRMDGDLVDWGVPEEKAEFWGVYGRRREQPHTAEWIADLTSRVAAEALVLQLRYHRRKVVS